MSIRSFTVFMLLTLFATASFADNKKREVIYTPTAPAPGVSVAGGLPLYAQGIKTDNFIFVSGQLPLVLQTCNDAANPNCWTITDNTDIAYQTCIVMKNINEILKAARSNLCNMVKSDVFLASTVDSNSFNNAYAMIFKVYCDSDAYAPPARATVKVSGIPLSANIEIAATAVPLTGKGKVNKLTIDCEE